MKSLDVAKTEVKTKYCISHDQRELQMKIANSRVSGRLEASEAISEEEVAIVCYGPSLNKTWKDIKGFKKIVTCSGAHKFLIDKGIIPTWHVDLDPREHKVRMLGTPHKDVEYLMASTCHPKMWDLLEGHNVKLWHIYSNEDNKNISTVYPRGDWILTGGNNVGLRCLVVARLLGYRNFHIFGMDCSFPKDSKHHADTHLNPYKGVYALPYCGKMYYGEPVMLEYARQFFHEMEQLPDCRVLLHGEGLLQHMAYERRNDQVKARPKATIAFSTPVTITSGHTEAHKALHKDLSYGLDGRKHKAVVEKLSQSMKTPSIMDYGCGKGTLSSSLPFPVWEYDPAIAGKDNVPRPADLVICTNVLQMVEPEMLDNVLGDLVRCTRVCLFAVIETGPSDRVLPDGRNLNLIQKDKDWWHKKLDEYFNIGTLLQAGTDLHCVLEPRKMGVKR